MLPPDQRPAIDLSPLSLRGRQVELLPLQRQHLDALIAAGSDEAIWTWYPEAYDTPGSMARFVDTALSAVAAGSAQVFVQRELGSGRIVGSTRLFQFSLRDRRAEIGWTWLAPEAQRSGINTEAKYLLLRHAFETLGLMRVEFKTDALNLRSRAAIARIGATQEGIFRRHVLCASGRVRDSVYFSIVDSEWPQVREHLQALLAKF
ncbi:Protein N-acetyltransferase, RimJ/RimL family [Solimonas aquatica]|uniref:Protein N-acetyltransferase, RimJ/RimL family n=1 Tax=Solimonas aquatica TaxID=489703 RepID=A0A1H9AH88_9GAMM|nr:GNAT family protein [Solimonas aquatica]SEP75965.1 Protein N-acetyltransferase, RimJ/RimL family [Solimonas aquatica]